MRFLPPILVSHLLSRILLNFQTTLNVLKLEFF